MLRAYDNDQTFGIMAVTGPGSSHKLILSIFNAEGNLRWTRAIEQDRQGQNEKAGSGETPDPAFILFGLEYQIQVTIMV